MSVRLITHFENVCIAKCHFCDYSMDRMWPNLLGRTSVRKHLQERVTEVLERFGQLSKYSLIIHAVIIDKQKTKVKTSFCCEFTMSLEYARGCCLTHQCSAWALSQFHWRLFSQRCQAHKQTLTYFQTRFGFEALTRHEINSVVSSFSKKNEIKYTSQSQ